MGATRTNPESARLLETLVVVFPHPPPPSTLGLSFMVYNLRLRKEKKSGISINARGACLHIGSAFQRPSLLLRNLTTCCYQISFLAALNSCSSWLCVCVLARECVCVFNLLVRTIKAHPQTFVQYRRENKLFQQPVSAGKGRRQAPPTSAAAPHLPPPPRSCAW